MPHKMWLRSLLMGLLILAMGVPPQAWPARAQQDGPQAPAPPAPSEPPKPPSGRPAPPPSQAPLPQAVLSVHAVAVTLDAVVTDQDGNLVTGLKRQNFRILDNGQPQQVTTFAPTEAPITIVILMEFSKIGRGYFGYKAREWSYGFLNQLKPQDWVALKTFDLRTTIRADFTQNKEEVQEAIASLYFPDFSEANLFDAVYETIDQLRDVPGKKSILVIATGFDTFSKHNLDQILRRLKETDITIFCIGMGAEIDLSGNGNIGYVQAQNQLTTFARLTGGYAWFPRFQGEMNGISSTVAAFLRNQYSVGFSPSSPPDGRYHKLTVQVVDDDGNPMELVNKKGKKKKVVVIAREGYTAPSAAAVD